MEKSLHADPHSANDRHPVSGEHIAWTLADQLATPGCALLIIDMQNDFVGKDGLLARQGKDTTLQRRIIPTINALAALARASAVPVIWIRTSHSHRDSRSNYLAVYTRDLSANRWDPGNLLVYEGSTGGQWHADLTRREPDEVEITKHGYSAFRDTTLHLLLSAQRIRTIVLTGVNTNVCIQSTAADGFYHGYYPILCEDACATADSTLHAAALSTHRTFYGLTATAKEISAQWHAIGGADTQSGMRIR